MLVSRFAKKSFHPLFNQTILAALFHFSFSHRCHPNTVHLFFVFGSSPFEHSLSRKACFSCKFCILCKNGFVHAMVCFTLKEVEQPPKGQRQQLSSSSSLRNVSYMKGQLNSVLDAALSTRVIRLFSLLR